MSWREVLACGQDQKPLTEVTEVQKKAEKPKTNRLVSLLSSLSRPENNAFLDPDPAEQATEEVREALTRGHVQKTLTEVTEVQKKPGKPKKSHLCHFCQHFLDFP